MAPANQTIDLPNEVGNTTSTPQDHVNKHYTPNTTTNPPMPGNFSYRITTSNQDNNHTPSTEEVVAIGKRLQEEFYNLTQGANLTFSASPANHTGNWKTAFLYNLAQLVANVFPTTVAPAKFTKPTIIPPANTSAFTTNSVVAVSQESFLNSAKTKSVETPQPVDITTVNKSQALSNKVVSELRVVKRKRRDLLVRRRRGLGEDASSGGETAPISYDLTPEIVTTRLKLTEAQLAKCRKSFNNLRRAVARYNALYTKNSEKGQDLLVKQSIFLEEVQKKAKLTDTSAVSSMMASIKQEFKSHTVRVEKHLHGIWVAGAPPEESSTYMKVFLEAYPGYDFFLWVDEKAFGAAKFTSLLKKIAFDSAVKELRGLTSEGVKEFLLRYEELKEKYETTKNFEEKEKYSEDLLSLYDYHNNLTKEVRARFDSLFLENMIVAQDGFFNFCILQGIETVDDTARIKYLEQHVKLPPEEIEQYKKVIESNKKKLQDIVNKVNKDLGEVRAYLLDIKQLQSMKDPTNAYNYDTEMFLRWNYAAATDQIRLYMLKEYGGIYMDLDMMPAYSKEVSQKIHEIGGNRFFEFLRIRRAISYAMLKLVGEKQEKVSMEDISRDLNTTGMTADDKEKLKKLLTELETTVKERKIPLFQQMASETIRDFMLILQRYHRWATKWNIRGLNGLMMAHKGSALVDAAIQGQRQAYAELRTLRQQVLSGEYFRRLEDLTHVDYRAEIGGVLVKNYLAGSLFTDFRQDSIISGAVSTLGISGPDLIMSEMVQYFRGLGPIGRDFLNEAGTRVGKAAFLGAYRELDPVKGERQFDWLNPLSVGANDVTPGDESTWCGIRARCLGELLFSDESKLRVETPKRIVRSRVNFEEFIQLWSEESRRKFPRELVDRFNTLIESPSVDIVRLSDLDQDIQAVASHITNDAPAKEAIFSLQWQIAELIRAVPYPISNQAHFFLDVHENFEADLEKAVKLYLKSHDQTEIGIWHSKLSDQTMFLKDILGIAERIKAINHIKKDTKYLDKNVWSPVLDTYVKLKAKEIMGILSQEEFEAFLKNNLELAKNGDLYLLVSDIETRIASGHGFRLLETSVEKVWKAPEKDLKKKVLSIMKEMTQNGDQNKEQKSWLEEVYDEGFKKRVTEPIERIQAFIKSLGEHPRVSMYDTDMFLSEKELFLRMQKEGYAFRDLNTIAKLMLANEGISGILSEESVLPSPSKQLVDLLRKSVEEDNYIDVHDRMQQVYSWLTFDPESAEGKEAFSAIPENLQKELTQHASDKFLTPPIDMSVTALGMQYGLEGAHESERVLLSVVPGVFNPVSHTMVQYIEALYEFHRRIHEGSLTKTFAKYWLEFKGAACFISDAGIDTLIEHSAGKHYLSLTEIHQELTGLVHLGQATRYLLTDVLPGAGKVMLREADFGRPFATTILDSGAVHAYDYRGVGSRKDLFSLPNEVPSTVSVIEKAKYTLLSWPEFYESHAVAWEEIAAGLGGDSIKLHPQTFLYDTEGRCMGLSMLYMSAEDASAYSIIQDNLTALSAVFQTKKRDKIPLTTADQRFLDRSLGLIDWLQYHGNKKLLTGGILLEKEWNYRHIESAFESAASRSALVTTPAHSLVVHRLGDAYRVTDPNFGHIDFPSLENAMLFIETVMDASQDIRERYGFSKEKPVKDQLKFYVAMDAEANNAWASATDVGLHTYLPVSLERMLLRGEVSLNHRRIRWSDLFELGGTVDHKRIDEHTKESDLERLKFDGRILEDYLSKNVLDPEQVDLVHSLMDLHGFEEGTPHVSPEAIVEAPNEIASFLKSAQKKTSHIKEAIKAAIEEINKKIYDVQVGPWEKISILDLNVTTEEEVAIKIRDGMGATKNFKLKVPAILTAFKNFGSMLNEVASTGVIDFDLGMVVVSLVQYARMIEHGLEGEALTLVSAGLGIKQAVELTLGAVIQVLGGRYLTEHGIENFRLESLLARQLFRVSERVGGSLGKAFAGVAKVLEFPILESVVSVWSLYEGAVELEHAQTHSEVMMLRVRVAFDSIALGLTLAAVAAPAAMLAIGPIAAIGMGASSIAGNIARKEERHSAWLKYKSFLIQGSRHIVKASPRQGILDLSENLVLGNVYLDLRKNPPDLKGERSYNANHHIGSKPGWTDWQVRARLGYGYYYTPYKALAQGHANSFWPKSIPEIPRGSYGTVILGYGVAYKATTEVVYLSNQAVWREAVMDPAEKHTYVDPLKPATKSNCTVIAGKTPLTVAPVRLLDENSNKEREDAAATYKDYVIKIVGGPGGLTVQVGGAGYYDLEGDPKAENVLSFRAIPSPFGVTFNLALVEQSVPLVRTNGTSLDILKIKQTGFKTIIGSDAGEDLLTGSFNTKFHLGKGGGTVHTGEGNSRIYIPRLLGDLRIKLTPNSTSHLLFLETLLSDWNPSSEALRLTPNNPVGTSAGAINIESTDSKVPLSLWDDQIEVRLKDGILLRAMQVKKANRSSSVLCVVKCDQLLWKKKHPRVSDSPISMIQWLKQLGWSLAPEVTLVQKEGSVSYYDEKRLFVFHPVPYTEIEIQPTAQYTMKVMGAVGCSYLVTAKPSSDTVPLQLVLASGGDFPQLLDFSPLVSTLIKGRLTQDASDYSKRVELQITSPRHVVSLILSWGSATSPEQTIIEIYPHVTPTLGEWLKVLNKTPGVEQTLYHHSALVPDRFEGMSNLNNTVVLMLGEQRQTDIRDDGRNDAHILGIENDGDIELKFLGEIDEGKLDSVIYNLKWYPASLTLNKFVVTIPAHEVKYLVLQDTVWSHYNVLLHSMIYVAPLHAREKPLTSFSYDAWKRYDEIQIYGTQLELQDFVRYTIASETPELSRQLMYAQDLVQIQNRDFILKFFYARDDEGIGAIRLVFKNFFNSYMEDISERVLEKEAKPMLLYDPKRLIDSGYWDHLELKLGEEVFNLMSIAKEFASSYHRLALERDEKNNLVLPKKYGLLNLVVLSHTIDPKDAQYPGNTLSFLGSGLRDYRLPLPTILASSYYLDPVSGDLYLTRIIMTEPQNKAFVIRFKGYKYNWLNFQNILVSSLYQEEKIATKGFVLSFAGPEFRHLYVDLPREIGEGKLFQGRLMFISSIVPPTRDQVTRYDPNTTPRFYTIEDYMLWVLKDRVVGSSRAKDYDNYLLEAALHLQLGKHSRWDIPPQILHVISGYYKTRVSKWARRRIRVGDRLKMTSHNMAISLITEQKGLFSRQRGIGTGYTVYYSILGLGDTATVRKTIGDMTCDFEERRVFKVRKVDESEYSKRRIYIVMEVSEEEEIKLRADPRVLVVPGEEVT